MEFAGRWHIYEMELWDEDYFNEEVQAFIQINNDGMGEFQFGYIAAELDGKVVKHVDGNRFEFSWIGEDEFDPVNGCGWIKTQPEVTKDKIEGEFRIHRGDHSTFQARKSR